MLEFTLRGLASLFAKKHSHHLRFSQLHEHWLKLDADHGGWRRDDGTSARCARELVEDAADAARNISVVRTANVAAVPRIAAAAEPAIRAAIPENELEPDLRKGFGRGGQ